MELGQWKREIDQLKSFLSAFKKKPLNFDSLHLNDYGESSVIGGGATSKVKEIRKPVKLAKKELKAFEYKSLQRFLKESEIILVQLQHPYFVRIVGCDYGDSTHL